MTDKTELYRQIPPNFFQNDQLTYLAFRPFPKDEGLLSVYDGEQITYENSYEHFTETIKLKSSGVLAVTGKECRELGLPPCPSPEFFPEHAHLDFNGLAKKQIETKSKTLLAHALKRGWRFQPES